MAHELPTEAIDLIKEYLQLKVPDQRCRMCGNGNLELHSRMTAIPVADIVSRHTTEEFYPAFMVVCSNCGCALQFIPTSEVLEELLKFVDQPIYL